MADWVDALFSAEVLAIAIPAIIFGVTVFLLIKRLVGFVATLLLLCFALASGLAIINRDVVRDYVRGEYSSEQVQGWKSQVSGELQKMWEALKDLKDLMIKQSEEGQAQAAANNLGHLDLQMRQLQDMISETQALIVQHPKQNGIDSSHSAPIASEEPSTETPTAIQ